MVTGSLVAGHWSPLALSLHLDIFSVVQPQCCVHIRGCRAHTYGAMTMWVAAECPSWHVLAVAFSHHPKGTKRAALDVYQYKIGHVTRFVSL